MLPAVRFDGNPSFEADKISNKPPDLLLTPELQPAELLGFQAQPQDPFRVGHTFSQTAPGDGVYLFINTSKAE